MESFRKLLKRDQSRKHHLALKVYKERWESGPSLDEEVGIHYPHYRYTQTCTQTTESFHRYDAITHFNILIAYLFFFFGCLFLVLLVFDLVGVGFDVLF